MREKQQGGIEPLGGKKSMRIPEDQRVNAGKVAKDRFEDSFTKRLGGSHNGDRLAITPSGRSKSNQKARRKSLDPAMLGSRSLSVPQVSEVGCGCKSWNGTGVGVDLTPALTLGKRASGGKTPSTPGSLNQKLTRSVTGIFFRRSKPLQPASSSPSSSNFEEEWSTFREQHQQEMKEMKQMYTSLQTMCQEIKTVGLQPSQGPSPSSQGERCTDMAKTPSVLHIKKYEVASEKRGPRESYPPARRARSAPRTRSGSLGCMGPIKDMSNPITLNFKPIWCNPTSALFEEIVQVQKAFLRGFCASVVKHGEAKISIEAFGSDPKDRVGALVGRLLPNITFAKPWHLKYGVEAWVNRVILREFGSESYGLLEHSERSLDIRAHQMSSWDEFQKLALLNPTDAIDPESKEYFKNFHMFCNRKFQSIHDELEWWDEWPQSLVEDFLEAMKHVWRAHKLAFAFEPPASMFCVKASTALEGKYMDPLDALTISQLDSSLFSSDVGFMVTPGFLVQDRIIKCQVYPMPKVGLIQSPPK